MRNTKRRIGNQSEIPRYRRARAGDVLIDEHDVEYLINEVAAKAIRRSDPFIEVRRLVDDKQVVLKYEQVRAARLIDHLEDKEEAA